jgi:hypothetical protein
MSQKTKIIVVSLVSVIAVAAVSKNYLNKQGQSQSALSDVSATSKVDVSTFMSQYSQNKTKFAESFKEVEIYGVVKGVSTDPQGNQNLFIGSNNKPEVINTIIVSEDAAKVNNPSVINQDAVLKCYKIEKTEPLILSQCKVIDLKVNSANQQPLPKQDNNGNNAQNSQSDNVNSASSSATQASPNSANPASAVQQPQQPSQKSENASDQPSSDNAIKPSSPVNNTAVVPVKK